MLLIFSSLSLSITMYTYNLTGAMQYLAHVKKYNINVADIALASFRKTVTMTCARERVLPHFTDCSDYAGSEKRFESMMETCKITSPMVCDAIKDGIAAAKVIENKMLNNEIRSATIIQRAWRKQHM